MIKKKQLGSLSIRTSGSGITDAAQLTTYDRYGIFNNNTQATYFLPPAQTGLSYTFIVTNTGSLTFYTASGDRFITQGLTGIEGGYITSATIGSRIKIIALDDIIWTAMIITGSWEIETEISPGTTDITLGAGCTSCVEEFPGSGPVNELANSNDLSSSTWEKNNLAVASDSNQIDCFCNPNSWKVTDSDGSNTGSLRILSYDLGLSFGQATDLWMSMFVKKIDNVRPFLQMTGIFRSGINVGYLVDFDNETMIPYAGGGVSSFQLENMNCDGWYRAAFYSDVSLLQPGAANVTITFGPAGATTGTVLDPSVTGSTYMAGFMLTYHTFGSDTPLPDYNGATA